MQGTLYRQTMHCKPRITNDCVYLWQDFWKFLSDDMALLRAARAKWTLVPAASVATAAQVSNLIFMAVAICLASVLLLPSLG